MQNKSKFHFFTRLFLALIFLFSMSNLNIAQEKTPSIKFDLFSVDALVISDSYNIDEKFSKKHNIPILTPFKIKTPRQDDVTILIEYGTKPNSMMIKFNFATGGKKLANKDRELIENLQFIPFDIEMVEHEERLKILTNLMAIQAFNNVTNSFEQKEYIGARRTKIGNIDVIDAVGKYTEPNLGLIYVRITGYLNPNDKNGVYSIANIIADKYELTNLDQLFLTGSGKTIESFEYLND